MGNTATFLLLSQVSQQAPRGSCQKRQNPQAPICNRHTRKVANAKVRNRYTNLTLPNLYNYRPTYHLAVRNFGVCDFSRLAVTDWRLRFLALSKASRPKLFVGPHDSHGHSRFRTETSGCQRHKGVWASKDLKNRNETKSFVVTE